MKDITAPEHGVEIEIRDDGKVVWVNVDGVCALRICQVPELVITDNRYPYHVKDKANHPHELTQEEKVEFRKKWDARVVEGHRVDGV